MKPKIKENLYISQFEMLSAFFKELRFSIGLTQKDLSQNTDIHRNTISRIENANNFSILTLLKLSDFYNLKPSEIIDIID